MSDQEAWHELCDLYLQEQDYAKAAFCMEELILHNPHNHLIHQRYAEIKYTQVRTESFKSIVFLFCIVILNKSILQGGFENMELAKVYYSQAIKLNPNNIRALFGLLLVRSSKI